MFNLLKKICSIKQKNKYKYEGVKISAIYLIMSFIWIYFSDRMANELVNNSDMLVIISTYKGWLYVVVTSIVIYLLIRNLIKKVDSTERELNFSYEELTASNEELQAYIEQLAASDEELRAQYDQIIENEKKLRISEEKNRAVIKAMPDSLFIIDAKGCFIDCKSSEESILLMPKEALIGKTLWEVLPEEISNAAYEKLKLVLKNGTLENFEYKLNLPNNEQYFELRIAKNNENELLVISRNITVERLSEFELKLSEERYKTLVHQMKQGLALYEAVINEKKEIIDFRFLDGNESHEKLTGTINKDNISKSILEIIPDIGCQIIKKFEHVVKTGEPVLYERNSLRTGKYYEVVAYRPKEQQLAVILTEITKRKQAEEDLKASEYTFRNLFEGSSDAILIIENGKVSDCNLAMIELLGYDSKESIIGQGPWEFSPVKQIDGKYSKEKAEEIFNTTLKNGKYKFEWWCLSKANKLIPLEIMLTSILLDGKRVLHSLCRDVSERKQLEQKLEYLSYHDQLTGLYNRRFFEEEEKRLDVGRNYPLTILMADVNGLKLVNDSFGHSMGDDLLKKVAEVFTNGCRADDIIARLGGDEFVILLPKTDTFEAEQIAKRIKSIAMQERLGSIDISISIGLETKNNKEEQIQEIFKKAEDHMYKKKLFESPSMRGKTINTIISTLHEKNKREEQHSHRVSALCQSIGQTIGLPEEEIQELKTVGLLHDIGKIAIDENILNKPGKLTEDEWNEIKRHPEVGYRILSTVNHMSEMAEFVLAHHERWDGNGYPKGLEKEQIPLQSRIIAIADAYDAMTSERSYGSALPKEIAIQELQNNAGTQFDPELVIVFIEKVL